MGAYLFEHAFGITAGGNLDIGNIAAHHRLTHLPEVMQLFFDQQNHAVDKLASPRVVGLRHHAFAYLFIQRDKIRLIPFSESKRFIGLQPVQQRLRSLFIRDILTHQQHRRLRRFQLTDEVIGQ